MVTHAHQIDKKPIISVKPILDVLLMRQGDFNLSIVTEDGERSVALFMTIFFEIKNYFRDNGVEDTLPNVEINSDNVPSVLIKNINTIKEILPQILESAFAYSSEVIIEHPLSYDYWVFDKTITKTYFYDFSEDEKYGKAF